MRAWPSGEGIEPAARQAAVAALVESDFDDMIPLEFRLMVIDLILGAGRPAIREAALREAYWAVRKEASAYRSGPAYQGVAAQAERDRDAGRRDTVPYRRHLIMEHHASGIEAGAEAVAAYAGLPGGEDVSAVSPDV